MTTPISVLLDLSDRENLPDLGASWRLSDAKVRNAKPEERAVNLADALGLSLYLPPTGKKVWHYRFRLAGKEQTLTIGSYPEIGLADARKAHRAARWLVERGESPLGYIKAEIERLEAERAKADMGTFGAVTAAWLKATESALSARTVRHRQAMLDKYVLPTLKDKAIDGIKRKGLSELLTGIDQKTPETAKHCRIYIKQIFDYALDQELVQGNPTPPPKVLVNQSSRKVKPRKALPLARLGEFLKTLDDAPDSDPRTKAALRLVVLTWTRTSEVTGARWSEFDLDAGVWVIPPERMKADEQHTVYLSRQAVEILRDLKKLTWDGEYLFPNKRDPQRPMCRMTLTAWRKRWGFQEEMEIHGLRAVASTWANESGKYRPDVVEVALAHKEQDRVRAAYNRAQFIGELRQLWQDWADVCDEKVAAAKAANVVSADFGKAA